MKKLLPYILFVLFLATPRAEAQTPELSVTTIERDPFVRMNDEHLEGFSIDLWRAIADDNEWNYKFAIVENFVELLRPVRQGTTDIAIANISITADREEVMDFSNSIFRSGLRIMVPRQSDSLRLQSALRDHVLHVIMITLIAILLLLGHLYWYAEKSISKRISTRYTHGMSDAIWWILTLGGFGRNLPMSLLGRITLLLWMSALTLCLTLATAQLTSIITTQTIGTQISTPADLRGKIVGTTPGSTSETYMREHGIDGKAYGDIEDMYNDISNGTLDAVIHDAPLLQYYASTRGRESVILVGNIFNAEEYGIAMPSGSPLREEINSSLLRLQEQGTYDQIYEKWFGTRN